MKTRIILYKDTHTMVDLYNKDTFSIADIEELILSHCEENIHLEFKSAGALDKSNSVKDEISKDISAFANADGGILIYGIEEKDHCASGKSFIDGSIYTKEWLEQVVSSKIQRSIDGLVIVPIREDGDVKKSIYVVKIPRSNNTPHMAADHRYYKRQNFKIVPLEEYEVRDLIGRKAFSKLEIEGCSLHYEEGRNKLAFIATIGNSSNVVERNYKVNVYLSGNIMENFHHMSLSWTPMEEQLHRTIKHMKIKLTSVGVVPLFPDEGIDICRFSIESKSGFSETLLKNSTIEIILYNEVGEQAKYETSMHDALIQ